MYIENYILVHCKHIYGDLSNLLSFQKFFFWQQLIYRKWNLLILILHGKNACLEKFHRCFQSCVLLHDHFNKDTVTSTWIIAIYHDSCNHDNLCKGTYQGWYLHLLWIPAQSFLIHQMWPVEKMSNITNISSIASFHTHVQ